MGKKPAGRAFHVDQHVLSMAFCLVSSIDGDDLEDVLKMVSLSGCPAARPIRTFTAQHRQRITASMPCLASVEARRKVLVVFPPPILVCECYHRHCSPPKSNSLRHGHRDRLVWLLSRNRNGASQIVSDRRPNRPHDPGRYGLFN